MLSRRRFLAASAALAATPAFTHAADSKPKKLVLIGGSQSHGRTVLRGGLSILPRALVRAPERAQGQR